MPGENQSPSVSDLQQKNFKVMKRRKQKIMMNNNPDKSKLLKDVLQLLL